VAYRDFALFVQGLEAPHAPGELINLRLRLCHVSVEGCEVHSRALFRAIGLVGVPHPRELREVEGLGEEVVHRRMLGTHPAALLGRFALLVSDAPGSPGEEPRAQSL